MDPAPTHFSTRIVLAAPARRPRSPDTTPRPFPNAAASSSRHTHSLQPCAQDQIPLFPPPDVMLHRDDAGSKVFLAIARSLLSVDNRATTVKDLADLAVQNGLGCQNSSAATQAITTYIRTHHDRCDADHDQPLLLSHNLSGTDADDDLIPALYSLQGGNPRKVSPARRTNFRKNTAVWYLSRATGAPCPFARAGIRLCEYANLGGEEVEERGKKRRRSRHVDEAVALGQKRKRPHRSCVARDSSDEGSSSENDLDTRPQKKLTLRIRLNCPSLPANRLSEERTQPMSDSDSDSSSDESVEMESCADVPEEEEEQALRESSPEKEEEEEPWRLPPYPRRSISIPCYTPSYDGPYPQYPVLANHNNTFRRSPSVAYSVGSLPPDSEDEDDYHISMTKTDLFSEESTAESDLESEDAETQFESPGPRSPSAPLIPPHSQVTVKEEPHDLQGMLDAWDDIDSSFGEPRMAITESTPLKLKTESDDLWDWDAREQWTESPHIKQEDLSFDSLFQASLLPSPSPPSSSGASESSPLHHGVGLKDEEWSDADNRFGTIRPRSKTVPTLSSQPPLAPTGPSSLSVPPQPSTLRSDTVPAINSNSTTVQPYSSCSPNLTQSIASLIHSMGSLCSSGVSPSSLVLTPSTPDVVLVRTCEPCSPPITATQIEDISVYQMVLGNFHFLRRIDTDFVNLSPIVTYLQSPFPVLSTVPNATVITKGSAAVVGIWVPLPVAQVYLKDHPAKGGEFDVFLSNELYERFPTALQDFHRSNAPGRILNQFGRHFGSTLQVSQQQQQQQVMSIVSAAEMLARQQHSTLPPVISISPSTSNAYALSASMATGERQDEGMDVPLSATEREIFDLCVVPDWDRDSAPSTATLPRPSLEDDRVAKMEEEEEEEMEEDGDDDADVSDASSLTSLESIPSSPKRPLSAELLPSTPPPPRLQQGSTSSSSPPDEEAPSAMEVHGAKVPSQEGSGSRPLRRSKRVADLTATHHHHAPGSPSAASSARAARSRGGRGSRNSIS